MVEEKILTNRSVCTMDPNGEVEIDQGALSALDQNIENVEEARWKVCLAFCIQSYIYPNTDIAYRNCWNSFDSFIPHHSVHCYRRRWRNLDYGIV